MVKWQWHLKLLLILSLCLLQPGCSDPKVAPERAIPNVSMKQLKSWVKGFINDFANIDSENQQAYVKSLKGYFSKEAWDKFYQSYQKHHLYQIIQRHELKVTSVNQAPEIEILRNGVLRGIYTWNVKTFFEVNYAGKNTNFPRAFYIDLIIEHAPKDQGKNGLQITESFIS